MIKEAEEFADEDKKVKERVDAKNAFDGYLHSMRSATEGTGENKGLSEKLDEEEKEQIMDALKDGQSWLDSNPEADAEEVKEKHKEIEGICAPIISKYYQGGGGGGDAGGLRPHQAPGGGWIFAHITGHDDIAGDISGDIAGEVTGDTKMAGDTGGDIAGDTDIDIAGDIGIPKSESVRSRSRVHNCDWSSSSSNNDKSKHKSFPSSSMSAQENLYFS